MVALLVVRRTLGPWSYRLLAFPAGLLSWSFVVVVLTVLGVGMLWRAVVPLLLAFVAIVALVGWRLDRTSEKRPWRPGPQLWGDVLFLAIVAVVCAVLVGLGVAIITRDSYAHYISHAFWLMDTGTLTKDILGIRGVIVPAANAGHLLLGSDMNVVAFPLAALNILAMLGYVAMRTAFRWLPSSGRAFAAAGVVLLLATLAPFLRHSVYVHSNMISAMYLFAALFALERAWTAGGTESRDGVDVWAFMAGLATLGFAATRPDGYAYVFVVHAVVAVAWLEGRLGKRALAAYFGTYLAGIGAALGVTFLVAGGLYQVSGRLSGMANLGMVAAGAVVWVVLLSSSRWGPLAAAFASRRTAFTTLVVLNAIVIGTAWVVFPDSFAQSISNNLVNMYVKGGFNLFWVWAPGVFVVGLLAAKVRDRHPWLEYLLYAIFQFMALAFLVHGATHPGRIGWSDSYTRLVIHILPVFFWAFAMELGGLAELISEKSPDEADRAGASESAGPAEGATAA
jgi:hypothetical protein